MPQYRALHTKLKRNNKQKSPLAQHLGQHDSLGIGIWKFVMQHSPQGNAALAPSTYTTVWRLKLQLEESWFYKVPKCLAQYRGRNIQNAFRRWGKLKMKANNAQNLRIRGIYYSGA